MVIKVEEYFKMTKHVKNSDKFTKKFYVEKEIQDIMKKFYLIKKIIHLYFQKFL